MKGKIWKKAASAALALLIVSGGVPVMPLSQVFERAAITENTEPGDVVDSGECVDYLTHTQ